MFWSKKTDKLVQSEHLTLEGQPSVVSRNWTGG